MTAELPAPPRTAASRPPELPFGVRLLHSLAGHQGTVYGVGFDPWGEVLASGSRDGTVRLWDPRGGECVTTLDAEKGSVFSVLLYQWPTVYAGIEGGAVLKWHTNVEIPCETLRGHTDAALCLAFNSRTDTLASGGSDGTVRVWDAHSGRMLRRLKGHNGLVYSVAFSPLSSNLASGGSDGQIMLWDADDGDLYRSIDGHNDPIFGVAYHPSSELLVSGSFGGSMRLWNVNSGLVIRALEGHADSVQAVAFSSDGLLLASRSGDGTIRLWDCETWDTLAVIPVPMGTEPWVPALAFHPLKPLLVTSGTDPGGAEHSPSQVVHVYEYDYDRLRRQPCPAAGPHPAAAAHAPAAPRVFYHTTGKVLLVGDTSVGKSALGFRLIHGKFEPQESTHGQRFWVFPALGKKRGDGTECEAILWDLAGQPDYRLLHALFVDNADLALVLFDASDIHTPLRGVTYWLKHLGAAGKRCPVVLVAARCDRGTGPLTDADLDAFCAAHGLAGWVRTSAKSGEGIEDLLARLNAVIPWDAKPAVMTTATFARIKEHVIRLKDSWIARNVVTAEDFGSQLREADPDWDFADGEMATAIGHLENYGYLNRLKTSKGEPRILLAPDLLFNLASSFVLEARRHQKGLGALEEKRLLAGGYAFPEIKSLVLEEQQILLDSAALLFLEHTVCFRETDPLRNEPYLVFPELINLNRPPGEDGATEEGVAYTVFGPTENVFASLVVLLGYTNAFTRSAQWRDNARYEVGDGLVCGFRQEEERDGELDFVLCFGPSVGPPVRTLFQGMFESFLARRNLTVRRFEPVICPVCRGQLDLTVVRQKLKEKKDHAFCNDCGTRLALPKISEPIQLTREEKIQVDEQSRVADERTRFEQAVFRVRAYVAEQQIEPPALFVSYAWGVPDHERWVERLAEDLRKAGFGVLLDKWDNSQIGASIARFVEKIEDCGRVVVVGTPLYRQKAKNVVSPKGSVVAAEWDLAGIRMLATEAQKKTILPVLLAGDESEAFPPLLRGRVYGDFRKEDTYFRTAFDLILSLYDIPQNHPAAADLREMLAGRPAK